MAPTLCAAVGLVCVIVALALAFIAGLWLASAVALGTGCGLLKR